jgi:hypothetical protein
LSSGNASSGMDSVTASLNDEISVLSGQLRSIDHAPGIFFVSLSLTSRSALSRAGRGLARQSAPRGRWRTDRQGLLMGPRVRSQTLKRTMKDSQQQRRCVSKVYLPLLSLHKIIRVHPKPFKLRVWEISSLAYSTSGTPPRARHSA